MIWLTLFANIAGPWLEAAATEAACETPSASNCANSNMAEAITLSSPGLNNLEL
jgi:hypothetical protein